MSDALTALSPLDGRYAGKVDALRPIFSEYGLIKARVKVEVEWLLALASDPGIVELKPFSDAAAARLRALADGFSVEDVARVKAIEAYGKAHPETGLPPGHDLLVALDAELDALAIEIAAQLEALRR